MSTPFLKKRKISSCNMKRDVLLYTSFRKNGGLAQLVRASASHAEGRRFESATLHQKQQAAIQAACCFWESPRADSKGAGVNDMPVACQSRDPARPQAGNPVGRTNNRRPRKGTPVVGFSAIRIQLKEEKGAVCFRQSFLLPASSAYCIINKRRIRRRKLC